VQRSRSLFVCPQLRTQTPRFRMERKFGVMPKHTKHLRHAEKPSELREPSAAMIGDHAEIARLAYLHWLDRGCPIGSPEQDWSRAEEDLKKEPIETATA